MPLDLRELVQPSHTAVVTYEIQRGVIGDLSALPELASEGQRVVPNIARICAAARARGVRVFHCTAAHRADGFGGNKNARLFSYMARAGNKLVIGSRAAEIVPEVAVADSDLVIERLHGLSPFQGTELDFLLRNEGIPPPTSPPSPSTANCGATVPSTPTTPASALPPWTRAAGKSAPAR